ncbi:glycosyltransferase [Chlorobium sp. N1]|uniref:glycosyltransferase n=1 Tax=Chlorobium sp. N1 TaxID=2491138 RepID=UPI00103FD4B2|nr:glycosyltransferase [Chlorobium sp. N1]TCD47534.1 glycosyltransferase [Chlorobium sp. N1]
MSAERSAMGWTVPSVDGLCLHIASTKEDASALAYSASGESIHLTQGLRSNGVVSAAQRVIAQRGLRHLSLIESIDFRGLAGRVRPLLYGALLLRWRNRLEGVLAIGADTSAWLSRVAPAGLNVRPFAYFLAENSQPRYTSDGGLFRVLFVGALIPLKRVGLLLEVLGRLAEYPFAVDIVGDGPQRHELEEVAGRCLGGRVRFHGTQSIDGIASWMQRADCLVLPSAHDGWGAVISEALQAGTPVICSSACGAKALVSASGKGGVFDKDDTAEFLDMMRIQLDIGRVSIMDRQELSRWARCAGAQAGAKYLEELLVGAMVTPVLPPWEKGSL